VCGEAWLQGDLRIVSWREAQINFYNKKGAVVPSYNKPNLKDFLKPKEDYWKNREVPPGTRRVLLADGRTSYVSSAASVCSSYGLMSKARFLELASF
jgi:hypothetical protein